MSGKATFVLKDGEVEIPADERVDGKLFSVALEAGVLLDDALERVTGVRHTMFETDLTTLYFATRLYDTSIAGILLVAHGLGRSAVHMERSQYEFFVKMLYYADHQEKAR